MAQILSRTCEHAFLALIYLARYGTRRTLDIAHLAGALTLSPHTLGKVLQQLVKTGIVVSKKGPDGGFRLGRPPRTIRLMDVLVVFHEDTIFVRCLIGIPVCSDEAPCPVHEQWGPLRQQVRALFESSTLADLITGDKPFSYFTQIGPKGDRA